MKDTPTSPREFSAMSAEEIAYIERPLSKVGRQSLTNNTKMTTNETKTPTETDTPETDALLLETDEGRVYDTYGPITNLARRLERERDEARREVGALKVERLAKEQDHASLTPLLDSRRDSCEWEEDCDAIVHTECGQEYAFEEDWRNFVRFCQSCGGVVWVRPCEEDLIPEGCSAKDQTGCDV